MNECLVVNNHTFDAFHIIQNVDPDAGFCALMTYALNGVRKAIQNNWLPVVNFDEAGAGYFYDPAYGDNVWDYYFQPVMGVTYADVKQLLDTGEIRPNLLHSYKPKDIFYAHLSDPERIATFWARDHPKDPAAWMAGKRELGREYVAKYIRVKPHITSRIEEFVKKHIKPQYTIGVHIRGTDFTYAEPTRPEDYFRAILELVSRYQLTDFKIFVATDQDQYVYMFKQEFGSKIITHPSLRSSSDVAPFKLHEASPYHKGEDVLIDTLLLSKCNYLLKCAAAGGEFALWFNSSLQCTDFALESRYNPGRFRPLTSAYVKLNIGHVGPEKLTILHAYAKCMHYIRAIRIKLWLWKIAVGRKDTIAHGKRRSTHVKANSRKR